MRAAFPKQSRTARIARAARTATWLLLAALAVGPSAAADLELSRDAVRREAVQVGERDGAPLYRRQFLSPVYAIDRIYRSMVGPMSTDRLSMRESGEPEVLWVTGIRSTIVSAQDDSMSSEYMCHTNVSFDAPERDRFRMSFPSALGLPTARLFTLSPGTVDVALPAGFGVPMMSDHDILLNTQVLNLNRENLDVEVRHRVDVEFIRNQDVEKPLTPLIPIGAQVVALVEGDDGFIGMSSEEASGADHGVGCSLGDPVPENAIDVFDDGHGRRFTGHWIVPPGRDVRHTPVTASMGLPYDTTMHYIAVHLHPFAESLELRDLTTGETVYKSQARSKTDQVGVADVESYSSAEGIPLFKDHKYELISVYNNTSGEEQDAMATMLMYVRAKDLYDFYFRKKKRDT